MTTLIRSGDYIFALEHVSQSQYWPKHGTVEAMLILTLTTIDLKECDRVGVSAKVSFNGKAAEKIWARLCQQAESIE